MESDFLHIFYFVILLRKVENCRRLVGREFLSLGFIKIHGQDFCSVLDIYLYRIWASTSTKEESVFLCRHYICCTVDLAHVYLR
jgi:hypothetical protein